jgi:hypothetical protein
VLVRVIATGIFTTDFELYDCSMSYYRDCQIKMRGRPCTNVRHHRGGRLRRDGLAIAIWSSA